MAQISNANLQSILDKLARHAAEVDGVVLASAVATGAAYAVTAPNAGLTKANSDVLGALQTLVGGFTDVHQLADLLPAVRDMNLANPQINNYLAQVWAAKQAALEVHAGRYNPKAVGDRSFLDALLRVLNATTPTLRAHGAFNAYFGALSPGNVFTPTPFALATFAPSGGTAGTFVHVAALDTTLYASGQIVVRNTKGEGFTPNCVMTFTCTKAGSPTSVTFTLSTVTNNWLTAGGDTAKLFTDCTAFVSMTGGFNGDTFEIDILPDRAIAAA